MDESELFGRGGSSAKTDAGSYEHALLLEVVSC
jgi:hypothetical protein